MNLNDSLTLLTQLFFILLGFVTIISFLRYGGRTRRDIAVMVWSLTTPLLISVLSDITGTEIRWLDFLGLVALVAQPYLLLRLAHYFHDIPRLIMQMALIAMVVSWVMLALVESSVAVPTLAVLLTIIAYFVAADGYAAIVFVQGAFTTSGVVQQRLRLAAAGSGFLALTLLSLGFILVLPAWRDGLTSIGLLAAVASALSYFLGFAPPHWLRRTWQLSELRNYLLRKNDQRVEVRLDANRSLEELCAVAKQATAGFLAAIAQQDESNRQWIFQCASGQLELINDIELDNQGVLEEVRREQKATFVRTTQNLSPGDRRLLDMVAGDTLFVSPIRAAEYDWGLLLVFLKRSSLFIEDDLNFITLLAQQCAMFLENSALIEELHQYSKTLEQKVEERTTEIQQLNQQLERRVAERTADLSRTNAELGKVVRTKDEFLANMSHELRTPLNGILILTEVLLEQIRGPLNERQTNSLHTIQTSSRHLLSLINDILDLSKIEAGKLKLQVETVSVEDICHTSLQFVKEQAHQKGIKLTFNSDNLQAQMQADPRRLKQILINLLNNAVKFTTDEGRVSLQVNADEAENVVHFVVEDTGIGIAAADMPSLFRPFTQLDSSLTRNHEGTGLGLSLVGRLVELHGGSVQVESEGIPGKGSRFTVSLPWQPLSANDEDPYKVPDLRQALLRLRTDGNGILKALIIEDSLTAAEQFDRYLKELGIQKVVHATGEHALEKTLETLPNFIILDLMMPHQSGWDVLAQLKADPRIEPIPVIIISVVDEPMRGLAAGAVDYLVKPITRKQFRIALGKIVQTYEEEQASAAIPPTVESPIQSEVEGPSILLAEDNEVNIQALGDYLLEVGYQVQVARNGGEAFNLALEMKPDLILMDIQMPVQDGLTVTQRLRDMHEFATTPIIALTALAMPGDRERCLDAGANEYLAKPINLKNLMQMIDQLLQEQLA